MALGPVLAQVKDVRLTLGGAPLFEGVEFALHKGARACLVGANGAGKSTLMRMLAGSAEPDSGEIAFAAGAVVALTAQDPDIDGFATLRDYASAPSVVRAGSAHGGAVHAAETELAAFGLDADRAAQPLSGGETRRAALARAFAADPDILLLDEPTNHLDIAAIAALEDRLIAFRGACLIISHDRRILERVSTQTLWLRQRRMWKLDRGFSAFDDWAAQLETEEARALARLETHLAAEEHWLRRGVTARRSRNEGRRRKLETLRAERRHQIALAAQPKAQLKAEAGGESGKLVIDAKRISKSFGDHPLIADVSLRIARGDRVGIVGPNGAGKTTLLNLLLKRLDPDAGEVRHGAQLNIAHIDQDRARLDPTRTLLETLAPLGGDQVVVNGRARHIAAYARDFLFSAGQLRQPVGALSGGERNRLALAATLARPANLLVLDEPTNDLDIDTLDALEDMLAGYEGTMLLVSHDRSFLDGVATQIVGPVGQGRWAETPGGWADFEREHGSAFAPRRTASAVRAASPPPSPNRTPTKLSYKDERRAAELETLLPTLHAEAQALEAAMSDPRLFAEDPAKFHSAAARLEAVRSEIDRGESDWLDIEVRREQLQRKE